MIHKFEELNEQDFVKLKDSIPLITLLIAGADGNIEEKELDWAEKIAQIRTYASTERLNLFYTEVMKDFNQKLTSYIDEFPEDTKERTEVISSKLSELNPILEKMEQDFAFNLYISLKSFAEHVAKSSGGFLRFFSVSAEEKSLISLPMLNPIEAPVDPDTEAEEEAE